MDILGIGKPPRFIKVFLLSAILFFVLTVPFHQMFAVFTVSEVRLSAVLYPFLGINYGLPAALGIMVANAISDAVNGYSISIILEALIPQFLYAMLPRVIWRCFVRNDEHKHRLDSVKRVLQFAIVCFISAFLAATFVGLSCKIHYGLDFMQVAKFVFLNNFEVSIILGCPLMIVANQIVSRGKGIERIVSINEKIIIGSAIAEAIILFIVIFTMYTTGKTIGTYDIWNSIYFCIISVVASMFVLTLIVMIITESTNNKK